MSPSTRSKNKRKRDGDKVDTTTEILRKVHATGGITDDELNQLYMVTKPTCQGCRVNTKDNPNCFCGLIPPPNGSRKSGLWQKTSDIVKSLGPDPNLNVRAPETPAGLTNLGATCYANSILQCLYMNESFRDAVFSLEADLLKQDPVLNLLTQLFAQLHASKMAFIDSAPFINLLEIDNVVQQDSHEFLTLLLSLLEKRLRHSKVSKARTIVQDLFRGRFSHVTTCSKCGKDSEASSEMEDFYELELNVKGLKSLGESLDDYFSVEELLGENQYSCELCKTKVDATRSIKLRTLPDIFNFQLRRCMYSPETTKKKKITSSFSFPGELDMRQRFLESSELESVYELSAVLIHKGTTVDSGHYVAHIKDEKTGQWWKFDDEHVSNLGCNPFGEGSSSSTSKPVREPTANPSCTEPVNAAANNHVDTVQLQSLESNSGSHAETFSSGDAYMLMYNLRRTKRDGQTALTVCYANNMEIEGDKASLNGGVSLPSHLSEEINKLNASYLHGCQQYKLRREKELDLIAERREEVRSVLSDAPVRSPVEPYYWISTDWIRQWAENITPLVLDNMPIQCMHGKVPALKVVSMKRLSAKAWTKLFSKYHGGPVLTNNDYCMDCLIDGARTVVNADSYRDRRTSMKLLASDALSGECLDGTYYVSKSWLHQWIKRKILDAPCEADAGPTALIRCPHGQLMPEQATGAKRLLVPEDLWCFFYDDSVTVKPDDPLGCSTFPSDSTECFQCSNELTEEACLEDSLKVLKHKQRQNHEQLVSGKAIQLFLHRKYYLVPSLWISKWKSYITSNNKNASLSVGPGTLDHVIEELKCGKHSRLLERPPGLSCKGQMIFQQKGSPTDGLTFIPENDWKCFCEEWGCAEEKGISAVIESCNSAENDLVGSCKEIVVPEEQLSPHNEENDELMTKQLVVKTSPETCEDCIGERESCDLMRKLNYSNEDICVYFVRGKEVPRSILKGSDAAFEPDRRISKRSRRTNFGNSIHFKVSASTSIYQLKMMIWESFGVVKENQILHKGSTTIDVEHATLADLNIFPGDMLWVEDSEEHEHRDIAEELTDPKMELQQKEGFRGTLLTGNTSSQVV